jgi:hypothetical protein
MIMTTRAKVKMGESIEFEVEADDEMTLFKEVARVTELYGNNICGKCNNKEVKFVSRLDSEGNDWLELLCKNPACGAKLVYGQTKKGKQIYPKIRWDDLSEAQKEQRNEEESWANDHNGYLPNKGWFIYKKKK